MQIEVQLFAVARELAQTPLLRLELPEEATVAELRTELVRQAPKLAGIAPLLRFAVDRDYATDDTRLGPGMEVACIPPVSGG